MQSAEMSATGSSRGRVDSIDLLRGAVMVLMALDHVRDFWGPTAFNPANLSQTTPGLFLTRWITHFCAPVFVFLAGAGAFFYGSRRSRPELSAFLVSRGVWLIVLEFTVVQLGWGFTYFNGWPGGPDVLLFAQVIWVIGVSMILLAGLIYLPLPLIALFGVALIAGHNRLDGWSPETAPWDTIWTILHQGFAFVPLRFLPGSTNVTLVNIYPIIPWVGVMAAGYAFGSLLKGSPQQRRRRCLTIGLAATAGFIVLRAADKYGEPNRRQTAPPAAAAAAQGGEQDNASSGPGNADAAAPLSSAERSPLYPALSFLNCTKYPPSLLFLLMTLGPALVALALFEHARGRVARVLVTYGRVPLFFYLLHIPLANASGAFFFQLRYDANRWLGAMMRPPPQGFEPNLLVVYAAWIGVVALLYPACRWFAGVKQRGRWPWLSYL